MVFTKLFWFAWRVALPLAHPSFHTGGAFVFWPLFLVSEFMTGYFLAFNFQVRMCVRLSLSLCVKGGWYVCVFLCLSLCV